MPGKLSFAVSFLCILVCSSAHAQDRDAVENFEKKVRPLLAQHCFECHGDKKAKGGLRLNSRAALLKGGDTGAGMVPGDPEKSLLVQAIRYRNDDLKMPPRGKLGDADIATLTAWIKAGAVWPESTAIAPVTLGGPLFTDEQKAFWAFQPPRDPTPPTVKDAGTPIDAFLRAALDAKGLGQAPAADRRTLLRRVTYDLTGLPPTPDEIDAFLKDEAPDAFDRVIDRLLDSPAYGERWGRHWLDVARYADSNGLDENTAFANAYRYRDYVIQAFNHDRPFDQFVMEQLAGDLMPPSGQPSIDYERLTATGFLVLGPKLLAEPDKKKMVMDIVDEQIDVTSKAFLGLTVSCARCHDHKFDPIPTRDYYGLAGIFRSTKTMETLHTVGRALERPLGSIEAQHAREEYQRSVRAKENEVNQTKDPTRKAELNKELDALRQRVVAAVPMALAVQDEEPGNCRIHIRGNHLALGDIAPRQFLRIVAGENQIPIDDHRSGRLELARWLIRADHPLTARVMVNRIWQHHFGEGLVRTVDNFGRLGERPTHPELLDWLAHRFIDSGWSIKAMHRLMVRSRAYQMSSAYDPSAAQIDPENRLLWRFPRRRLEVEAIRDSMLAINGHLDRTMGGSLLKTGNFSYVTNDQSSDAANYHTDRRSIYLPVIRNAVYNVFQIFDFVEPSVTNGHRDPTTVAPQALFLMNSPFVLEQAQRLAKKLLDCADLDDAGRINLAHVSAYARPARPQEIEAAQRYLKAYAERLGMTEKDGGICRQKAWQSFCQALMAANEFVYLN